MNNIRKAVLALLSFLISLTAEAQQNLEPYQMLNQAMAWIENMYVDTVNIQQMSEVALRAMLKELDPHSSYLTPDEVKAMNENLGGNFEGIGVSYQMENDTLLIISTIPGGPSEKAGVMATDRIILVNDSSIAGQQFENKEIQRRLRGPKDSKVKISVMRMGEKELIDFVLTRDKIPVHSVDAAYMVSPTVGFIKVLRFASTTGDEVKEAMKKLTDLGMEDVIIDLQDNGGGYMNAAVDMANIFLPANKMIVYTQGRGEHKQAYNTSLKGGGFKGRVVVLIDEQSASAAEIFTGAIQDYDRGVVVGRRSFGKGLVQRPIPLPGGGMMKLTVSHYYTPSGRCVQKPYTKGDKASYDKDLETRIKGGELQSADSIHFPDSLKYHTEFGRTVYGGGGIMPDIFVPMDTLRGKISKTHRNIIAKGTFNRFVLAYFKENQKKLKSKYPEYTSFAEGFTMSDEEYLQLIELARKDTVTLDSTELETSKELMKLQFKAYIANDTYGNGHYARVMNVINPIFERGVAIIQSDEYQDLLLKKEE